jgi:hypothetical protein
MQAADRQLPEDDGYLVHGGHRVKSGNGAGRVAHGIAKFLSGGMKAQDDQLYNNAQSEALKMGNLDEAAGNAAQYGDMDRATKFAEAKARYAKNPNENHVSEYDKAFMRKKAERDIQDMEDAAAAPAAEKNVLEGIRLLEEIAADDRIGSWTRSRWLGQSGNEQRDLAKINQAASLLAPERLRAYSKAGGSKPNSDFEAILATGIDTKTLTSAQAGEIARILKSLRTSTTSSTAQNNIPAGTVQDGYVFLGGDPADPNNWRPE